MHVIKLAKNSGSGAVPRNVGINFARGKYLAFMDNDDLFTPTALEELSTLAENFQADVVHTDKFLCFNNEKKIRDDQRIACNESRRHKVQPQVKRFNRADQQAR